MYTFCPECSTVFAIKAEHLSVAGGLARCGECHEVFRAVDYLYENIATAHQALADYRAAQDGFQDDTHQGADAAAGSNNEDFGPVCAEGSAPPGFPGDTGAERPVMRPVYATGWSRRRVSWKDVAGVAGIALLLMLLAAQWLFFNRVELAADSSWRTGIERLCAVLPCELPLRVDLSQIELLNRDVRKHPLTENALLINATLINHAAFIQPYPVFSIGFSDLSGKPIAVRRFSPAEYLSDEVNIEAGMSTDFPVHVVLEIQDPGEDAVSFQFEFL